MKRSSGLVAGVLSLFLLAPNAAAQTYPGGATADLAVAMEGPATPPLIDDTFQVVYTVTNNGPDDATDSSFSQYFPGELRLESVTSSDPADACSTGDSADDTTTPPPEPKPPEGGGVASPGSPDYGGSPGYYGDSVYCALGTMASGDTSILTVSLRRVGARETYSSAWVGSYVNDPVYENNYADLYLEADMSSAADVGVKMTAPDNPSVGNDFTYTLTITNGGPEAAESITLYSPTGYGVSFVSADPDRDADRCELVDYSDPAYPAPEYGGYSELYCELSSLGAGDSTVVAVTVNRASAYEIWLSASVQTTSYDGNWENDYAYSTVPADPSVTSDLGVTMTASEDAPVVGTTFDLNIDVTNNGPAASGDTWLSNYLPPGLSFVSTAPADTCSYNDWGRSPMVDEPTAAPSEGSGDSYYPIAWGGVYCSIGRLASGDSSNVTITVTRTNAHEIWNSAWVSSSNHDPNYENNYSDLVIAPDKSNPADVSVTMTAPTKPDVGSAFAFTLEVTNNGPSAAEQVTVADYLPYGVDYRAVSSDDPTDSCTFTDDRWDYPPPGSMAPTFYGLREVVCDLGILASGETATVTIDVTRSTEYEIWNSAWVSTANYDENYENNYSSVLVEGEPYGGGCPTKGDFGGTSGSDQIVIGDCYAETKGGDDQIEVVPPSSGRSSVDSGGGSDTVNVNLSLGSESRRQVAIDTGRGRDLIRIKVSPGAGNATIEVHAGGGKDRIEVDAPASAGLLRIVIFGDGGNDTVTWTGSSQTGGAVFPGFRARGGDGVDLLQGGPGNDRLFGGPGGDRLYGSLGDDILKGGLGYDVCRGGPGQNGLDC